MIPVVYCFDSNYNHQAFTSIISLLDSVSNKIEIFIIHELESDKEFLPEVIKFHKMLDDVTVYKFNNKNNYKFPNISNSHVSEATYYRIFIEDYIPKTVENVIYLDADIVCSNDPFMKVNKITSEIISNNLTVAARTEHIRSSENQDIFNDLIMDSQKYFNAGVMIINLASWRNLNIKRKLINALENLHEKIKLWDQDLLNHVFDGNYIEIEEKYNYVVDLAGYAYKNHSKKVAEVTKDNYFIHFAGSHKPWFINGILCNLSEIYQLEYRKLSNDFYHLEHKMKRLSLLYYFKSIINKNLFKVVYPIKLSKLLFLSIFRKR